MRDLKNKISSEENKFIYLQSKLDLSKSRPLPEPLITEHNKAKQEVTNNSFGKTTEPETINKNLSSQKQKVILVDDDEDMLDLLCDILEEEPYNIDFESSGLKAIDKILQAHEKGTPYDLLVVDMNMPEISGSDLISKLQEKKLSIATIVLTGNTDLHNALSLLKNFNISDFITKPLDNPERLIFSAKNALEKHQLYHQLIAVNTELEQRVKERTRELKVEKERAEFANQAKSNFLNHMSHELRSPMNAILGYAQLMQMEELDQNQKDSMDEIYHAAEHLLTLIDELLDLAHVESGKLNINMDKVSLNHIITQSIALVYPLAEDREQKVEFVNEAEDFHVLADDTRLKQVLLNLLSNAIKYSYKATTIHLEAIAKDHRLRLNIVDRGDGLSDEKISRLFTPFERFEKDHTTEGTGIGLVITKNLLELMNGKLGVENNQGQGSTFWIELDLV